MILIFFSSLMFNIDCLVDQIKQSETNYWLIIHIDILNINYAYDIGLLVTNPWAKVQKSICKLKQISFRFRSEMCIETF